MGCVYGVCVEAVGCVAGSCVTNFIVGYGEDLNGDLVIVDGFEVGRFVGTGKTGATRGRLIGAIGASVTGWFDGALVGYELSALDGLFVTGLFVYSNIGERVG